MSYTPTEWKKGDVVTSSKLNNLEEGVQSAKTVYLGFNTWYESNEWVVEVDDDQPEEWNFDSLKENFIDEGIFPVIDLKYGTWSGSGEEETFTVSRHTHVPLTDYSDSHIDFVLNSYDATQEEMVCHVLRFEDDGNIAYTQIEYDVQTG